MVIHTGEKNLKCDYCDKLFMRRQDLKQHVLTHTQCVGLPPRACGGLGLATEIALRCCLSLLLSSALCIYFYSCFHNIMSFINNCKPYSHDAWRGKDRERKHPGLVLKSSASRQSQQETPAVPCPLGAGRWGTRLAKRLWVWAASERERGSQGGSRVRSEDGFAQEQERRGRGAGRDV